MPLPPMVSFTRTKNLRDILIRAQVPGGHREVRSTSVGFKKCGKRDNCFATQLLKLNFSQEVSQAVALLVILKEWSLKTLASPDLFHLLLHASNTFTCDRISVCVPQKSMSLIKCLFWVPQKSNCV